MGVGVEGFLLTFGSERLLLAAVPPDAGPLEVEEDYLLVSMVDEIYNPIRGEFGPLNLGQIHRCVKIIDKELNKARDSRIVYCVPTDPQLLTNAVFVLGCYRIIMRGDNPMDIWDDTECIEPYLEGFRDSAKGECDFDVSLLDCWDAIEKAKMLGWVDRVDVQEYNHYINSLEGDLHIIIPDELIAFKGPVSMIGDQLFEDVESVRTFSPKFYGTGAFADMNVRTVIRLGPREYDESEFEEYGIRCEGLEFEGSLPSPDVVSSFLHLLRASRDRGSATAVHCSDTGLGRVGTLCALYLMSSYSFSAREAVAWMRVMRPGSVIGDQQHMLCAVEQIAAPYMQQQPESFDVSVHAPSEHQDSFDLLAVHPPAIQQRSTSHSNSWSSRSTDKASRDKTAAAALPDADPGIDAIHDVGRDLSSAGVNGARARQTEIWRALAIHRGVSRAVSCHRVIDHVMERRRPESPLWVGGPRSTEDTRTTSMP